MSNQADVKENREVASKLVPVSSPANLATFDNGAASAQRTSPWDSDLVTSEMDEHRLVIKKASKSHVSMIVRKDIGDPKPEKEILPFLKIPHLLAERVLQLARENKVYHMLGVAISRQALRLVLHLNAKVDEGDPKQEELDERVKLRDQLLDLAASMKEWGVKSDMKRDVKLKGEQGYTSIWTDARGNPSAQYSEDETEIKNQYDLFFAPRFYFSSGPEDLQGNFARLLEYDKKTTTFDLWCHSRNFSRPEIPEEAPQFRSNDPKEVFNVTPIHSQHDPAEVTFGDRTGSPDPLGLHSGPPAEKPPEPMSDDRRPKILLSLDGGGVKGWSQLDILYDVIKRLKDKIKENSGNSSLVADEDLKEEQVFPCDYFDLIIGSGTGGINAILIGRLGLSIKQCRDAWKGLDEVFTVERDAGPGAPLFSAEKLEKWAKKLVKEHTDDPETMMLIKNDDMEKPNLNRKSCKVGVTSMRSQIIGLPAVFRSYRVRANAGIDCAIWEVLRATTASPILFKSVFIGRKWAKQEFINAELGANNPISYLYQEKQKIWLKKDNWPPPEIGCVLSVGTGKDMPISLPSEPEAPSGWSISRLFVGKPDFDPAEKLQGVMLRIAKDCERKHQEVEASYGDQHEKVYFRLNVGQGMQDFPEDDYNIHALVSNYVLTPSGIAFARHSYVEDEYFDRLIEKMIEVLGTDPGRNVAPAYEPPANQPIIEKGKGLTKSLGATSE